MKFKLCSIILGVILVSTSSLRANEALTFSVSPERNVSELAKLWIPVLNELSSQTGLKINFTTARDASTFNEKLKKGKIDAAFVDPYAFSSFLLQSYQAVAKPLSQNEEAAPLGIIVVHKSSDYKTIDDLAGKSFSFADEESFSASVLPRFHMQASGIKYKASFVRSSMSSALAVSRRLNDAAGLEMRFYNTLNRSLKKNLRIVWTSTPSDLCQGMQNHPFVFALNKKLSKDIVQKIQLGLINLNSTSHGQLLLKRLGIDRIQLASNSEWAGMQPLARRIFSE